MESMISNRKYKLFLNGKSNGYKYLQNGLSQGSVLSLLLFNIYIANTVETEVRKFIHNDDITLVVQAKFFTIIKSILNQDLTKLQVYFNS